MISNIKLNLQVCSGSMSKDVVHNTLESPVVARLMAVQGVEGDVYYNGIRFVYYGCGMLIINEIILLNT